MLFLTIMSIVVRACLIKINEWKLLKTNKTKNVPLVSLDDSTDVIKILHDNDKCAIKNLIANSNDDQLKKNLRFLNMEGTKFHNIKMRRDKNKFFFQCLLEIEGDKASALVWLKNNNDFSTCRTIISDWKYSGEISKEA